MDDSEVTPLAGGRQRPPKSPNEPARAQRRNVRANAKRDVDRVAARDLAPLAVGDATRRTPRSPGSAARPSAPSGHAVIAKAELPLPRSHDGEDTICYAIVNDA